MTKKIFSFGILSIILFAFFFWACNNTDDGDYVKPITLYEKVNGSWLVTSVKQIDEVAVANAKTPTEMTITNLFDFATFKITLSTDVNDEPTTYLVEGAAPLFFDSSGYWGLTSKFPSFNGKANQIVLYSDEAKTKQTGVLTLASTPGEKKEMELKFTRSSKGVAFVSYVYKLSLKEDE